MKIPIEILVNTIKMRWIFTAMAIFVSLVWRVVFKNHALGSKGPGQIITTFPAGWSPQTVVKSKGPIPPKMAEKMRLRIYFINCQGGIHHHKEPP